MLLHKYIVGLQVLNDEYSMKPKEGKSTNMIMFRLAWEIKNLSNLIEFVRTLKVTCQTLRDTTTLLESEWVERNIPCKLDDL